MEGTDLSSFMTGKEIADKVSKEMKDGIDTIGDYGAKCADQGFWEGFDAALDLVINTIREGGFFESDEIAN